MMPSFNRSVTCLSGSEWHKVHYFEWTHPLQLQPDTKPRIIVCWHGLARNARDYDILAQHLLKNIPNLKVIAVDTPGRGKSDWLSNPASYSYPCYSQVATTIIASLGDYSELDWIGTSMGGILGMFLCSSPIKCPISRLVLVDVGPFISAASLERIGSYVGKDPKFKNLEEAEQYLRQIYKQFGELTADEWREMTASMTRNIHSNDLNITQNTPADHTSSQSDESVKEDQLYPIRLHYDPKISQAFISADIKDVVLWPLWDLIKVPVMVIHGKKSDILTTEITEEMQKRGPNNVKLVVYEDCGHTPHFTRIDKCNDIVNYLK